MQETMAIIMHFAPRVYHIYICMESASNAILIASASPVIVKESHPIWQAV